MTRQKKSPPPADELKKLARGFVEVARTSNLDTLRAELTMDEQRVEVIVERSPEMAETGVDETLTETGKMVELVTVKVGPKSNAKILVAAPAAWLDE